MKRRIFSSVFGHLGIQLILIIWAVVQIFPIIWMFYSSLKSTNDILANTFALPSTLHLENYSIVWTHRWATPLLVAMRNSVIVTSSTIFILIVVAVLAAWAIAKFRFVGNRFFLGFLIVMMSFPIHCFLIPVYLLMVNIHLINRFIGLILVYVSITIPFTVAVLQAHFRIFPNDIVDAAKMDGVTELGIVVRIVVPISKGVISSLIIINLIAVWNEFLIAFVLIRKSELTPLTVGVYQHLGFHGTEWNYLFAAISFAYIVPMIIYLVFSKNIVEGTTLGAIKE